MVAAGTVRANAELAKRKMYIFLECVRECVCLDDAFCVRTKSTSDLLALN